MQIDPYKAHFAGSIIGAAGLGMLMISMVALSILVVIHMNISAHIKVQRILFYSTLSILSGNVLLSGAGIWTCTIAAQILARQARQSFQPNGS